MNDTPEKILDAFGFGILQNMVNVMTSLEKRGVAEEDVKEVVIAYVAKKRAELEKKQQIVQDEQNKKQVTYENKAPKCPKCGAPLMLRPIKAPKGIQNKKGYKSVWYCINEETDCVYEKYSLHDLRYELKGAGITIGG